MNSLLPGHQCYKISTGRFERCSGCSRLAILDSDVLIRHGHPIVHTVATGIVGVDETFDVADAMSFLREAEMLLILRAFQWRMGFEKTGKPLRLGAKPERELQS